jgi:type I restriction enzyme S subunit
MPKKKLAIGEIAYSESSNVSQQSLTIMPEGNFPVFGAEGIIKKIQQFEQKDPYIGIIKDGAGVGRLYLLPGESTIIGTLNYIKPKKGIDLNYLYQAFKSLNFTKYIVGSGIPHIYFKDYKVLEIPVPEYETQKKLGSFLSAIDRLIEKQREKVDRIKSLKKGYLQKMFPADGESEPKLHFHRSTNSWHKFLLGDLAQICGGGTPSTSVPEYWNGYINWYSPVEIKNQVYVSESQNKITELGLKNSSAKILPIGTVLFTSRAGIGKSAILASEGSTNQGFQSIIPKENKLDNYFIYSMTEIIKKYAEKIGAGSTFIEVSGKQMAAMPILVPEIREQKKVGNFFKELDKLLSKEKILSEKYEQIKKRYLQKIFAD